MKKLEILHENATHFGGFEIVKHRCKKTFKILDQEYTCGGRMLNIDGIYKCGFCMIRSQQPFENADIKKAVTAWRLREEADKREALEAKQKKFEKKW